MNGGNLHRVAQLLDESDRLLRDQMSVVSLAYDIQAIIHRLDVVRYELDNLRHRMMQAQ